MRADSRRVRSVVALALVGAGCSGLAMSFVFSQPGQTKWLFALVPCLAAAAILVSEHPRTSYACCVVLVAPFADLRTSLAGVELTPLVAVLAIGVPVVLLTSEPLGRRSHLGRAVPWTLALLFPALIFGTEPWTTVGLILAAGLVAWTCVRAEAYHPAAVRPVYLALLGAATVQALLAVYEFVAGRPVSIYGGGTASYADDYFFSYGADVSRVSGTFFDPISLGNLLALAVPMSAAIVLDRRSRAAVRIAAVVVASVVGFGLALTYSRMSWNGAALGLLVVPLVLCRGYRLRALAGIIGGVVVLAVSAAAVAGSDLQVRFASILNPTASSVSTADGDLLRERIWAAVGEVVDSHTYFGLGFGNLTPYLAGSVFGAGVQTHAHSLYLQVAAEAGLLGIAALVLVVISAARDLRRATRLVDGPNGPLVAGVAGAIASLVVSCSTDYTMRYTAVLSLAMVPFALLALLAKRADDTAGTSPAAEAT